MTTLRPSPALGVPAALAAVALMLTACAGAFHATPEQLRARASFDLQCDGGPLEVVEIDPRTRGVRGCGKQATYIEQCKPCANGYVGCECTWVMNTAPPAPSPPAQAAPAQPPPAPAP